jgi:hypothetical protein
MKKEKMFKDIKDINFYKLSWSLIKIVVLISASIYIFSIM